MFQLGRIKWLLFIVFISAIFVFAYLRPVDFLSDNFTVDYENAIALALLSEYAIEPKSLNISYTEELDKSFVRHGYNRVCISHIIFTDEADDAYESIVFLNFRKMRKLHVEIYHPIVVDKSMPFTRGEFSITTTDQTENDSFTMQHGVINDDSIFLLNIVLSDGITIDISPENIMVAEQTKDGLSYGRGMPYDIDKFPLTPTILSDFTRVYAFQHSSLNTYMCSTTRRNSHIKEIGAYSASGELIYMYSSIN